MRRRVGIVVFLAVLATAALIPSTSALAQFDAKSIIVNPNPPFSTSIWTDRSQYYPGDKVTIYFRTTRDAYIYVFDIDTVGNVSLIFPNIYSENNYRRANSTYSLPDNSRYNLTVGGPSGVEQLVMFATPSKIKDVEWLRRSLSQGSFGPQLNVNISAERFMIEVKSVTVTPNFGQDWASASATFTVGQGSVLPVPQPPPPPVARGVINLTSRPSGAQVFLDGVEQGATPITVSGVSYGVHDITVVKNGYYTFSRQITVNSPSPYQVHAELVKVPSSGGWGNEVLMVRKAMTIKWPSTGPFTEAFTYRGSTGNIMLSADPLLGMLTRITASMTSNAVGPVQFAEITPSGPDAPWPGRVYEKVQYPFRARVTVQDYRITTGVVFGIEYLENVTLQVEVWYIGD